MKKILLTIIVIILLTSSGCINTIKKKSGDKIDPDSPKPSYFNFPDVLIPLELTKDREGSVIYMNSNTKAGVLNLTGKATFGYLIDFFKENMDKDNWHLVSENETSTRMILMFRKKCRWSIIDIDGDSSTARVSIWVTPSSTSAKPIGLLK
ncbi:MAG: hypothetical protein GY714_02055 [Desulfobacterales bacterium]|nr:hypothetical protein [Desulfobacterales bacterium]